MPHAGQSALWKYKGYLPPSRPARRPMERCRQYSGGRIMYLGDFYMTAKFHIRRSFLFICLFLVFGKFGSPPAFGQSFTNSGETLQISGHYSYIYRNNRPGITNNFHFIALTTSNGWSISATNDNNSKDWGLMRFDGTNIYTLITDVGNSPPGYTNKFEVYGYVYSGQFYLPEDQDSVHLFLPWMAFHLSPQMIQDSFEHNGVIEMPMPWGWSRFSLGSYGYKWIIKPPDSDRIIQRIDVVRDVTLDLKTEEDELRRAAVDYPFTIAERNEVLRQLQYRKNEVLNDFVLVSYQCTEIVHTNDISIPSATHFISFYPNFKTKGSIVIGEYTLDVDQVKLLHNANISDLIPPAKTFVFDFRYQATNSRTKFNYASYTLNAGEQFKSDKDPELLAQANHWLKHGPGYDSYKSKRRIILVGMLVFTMISGGLLLFLLKPAKKL